MRWVSTTYFEMCIYYNVTRVPIICDIDVHVLGWPGMVFYPLSHYLRASRSPSYDMTHMPDAGPVSNFQDEPRAMGGMGLHKTPQLPTTTGTAHRFTGALQRSARDQPWPATSPSAERGLPMIRHMIRAPSARPPSPNDQRAHAAHCLPRLLESAK